MSKCYFIESDQRCCAARRNESRAPSSCDVRSLTRLENHHNGSDLLCFGVWKRKKMAPAFGFDLWPEQVKTLQRSAVRKTSGECKSREN